MHAPAIPRPRLLSPGTPGALRALVAVQLAVLTVGLVLVIAPDGRPGGNPGVVPSVPGSPTSPGDSAPPSPFDPTAPTGAPTGSPTLEPTRPAQPLPTVTPGALDPTKPPRPTDPAHPTAPPGSGGGPPHCAYLDVLTEHHHLDDWHRTLLDTIYRLPSAYAPGDLVDTSAAGLNGGYAVRGFLVGDLRAMVAAAKAAGAPLAVVSGYRSYTRQQATFQHWVDVGGYEQALATSARPGHSEHQLGTALDLTSLGGAAPWEYDDWAATPAGAWVARNSWRYGFVVSYPRGARDRTCYAYEPWHVRYVGRERAADIVRSGLTAREVLWTLQ